MLNADTLDSSAPLRCAQNDISSAHQTPTLGASLRCARNDSGGLLRDLDGLGDLLSHHHDGDVDVGAYAVRHNGGVGDSQTLQSMYLAVLVHDGHGIGSGAHLVGA